MMVGSFSTLSPGLLHRLPQRAYFNQGYSIKIPLCLAQGHRGAKGDYRRTRHCVSGAEFRRPVSMDHSSGMYRLEKGFGETAQVGGSLKETGSGGFSSQWMVRLISVCRAILIPLRIDYRASVFLAEGDPPMACT
jgi:hypothetical protein